MGFLIVVCWTLVSCKKELSASGNPTTITLQFNAKVDIAPLVLNTPYTNAEGEQYSVTVFKYYISTIQLISSNGTFRDAPPIYHLVDASDTTTSAISFTGTADSLSGISFLVGMDSAHAPGPIMADLEGVSPASDQPGYAFIYQVKGFTGPSSVLRKITLALPGLPITLNPILPDTVLISIDANVNAWFSGPHVLPITDSSTCTIPGPLASQYADNYAKMFIVRNVQVK